MRVNSAKLPAKRAALPEQGVAVTTEGNEVVDRLGVTHEEVAAPVITSLRVAHRAKTRTLIGTLSSRAVDRFARPGLRTAKYRIDALLFKI